VVRPILQGPWGQPQGRGGKFTPHGLSELVSYLVLEGIFSMAHVQKVRVQAYSLTGRSWRV
jgi:hypothetical protein